jgi:radical SAM protein with 4Fe4S-binding SPASM domain
LEVTNNDMNYISPRANKLIAEATKRSIPLDVSIELTHHCNFRCQHCYIPDFGVPDGLTTERVMTLLDELAALGTMNLTLTGGEVLLRRDWYQIGRRARSLGFTLRFLTNGATIDEAVADQMQSLFCGVEISFYAADELVFEEVSQRKGSYKQTLRGIELLLERNIPVTLKTPVMSLNLAHLPAIRAYAAKVGAQSMTFATIFPKKNGDPAPLALRLSDEQMTAFYRDGPTSGCHTHIETSDDPRIDGPQCAAASRYAVITYNGDVMACNLLPGAGGNVLTHAFKDIWENSDWLNEVRSIRRKDLKTCNDCSRVSYCGRCHAQAVLEDGDLYGPSSYAQRRADIIDNLDQEAKPAVADTLISIWKL